jgi:large subunit ribosomal protein L24
MFKIRKGDTVQVIKGKDRGKRGRVLEVFVKEERALVEGINLGKKAKRKTQQDQQGGIISLEMPIHIACLSLVCKSCNRPVRVGFTVTADRTKSRYCKVCKEAI